MGLGPIQAIYQAHVMKYLDSRGLMNNSDRKVWAFLGDGEMDEPESLGAISKAGREQLDNLIFVINCNLQRLDGPVRGNGKIIQELEGVFRGAGWNVIKVIWGRHWDPLFQADKDGILQARMDETVDGEYQNYASRGGEYTREHFFGKSAELLKQVEHLSDSDIMALNRGGHDPYKVYAAYAEAVKDDSANRRMIFTALHETFITYLKVAFFAAMFVSSPIILTQIWKFVAPGLYKNEKRALLPYLIATPTLFLFGGMLVYYLIMPLAIKFFLTFETSAQISILPCLLYTSPSPRD